MPKIDRKMEKAGLLLRKIGSPTKMGDKSGVSDVSRNLADFGGKYCFSMKYSNSLLK